MNETFLNISGADSLVDAVRRCWASLFGGRTVFYRAKRGLSQADMDIAVVVQRQIASTRAGVMFTIDPSSGDTSRIVIEGASDDEDAGPLDESLPATSQVAAALAHAVLRGAADA